jgi:hypothetical protein
LQVWERDYPRTVFHEDIVQGATLASIFESLRWREYGWMSVDVESAETMVFETIDWSKVWARYVSHEGTNAEVEAIMTAAGYEPAGLIGMDILYTPGPAANSIRNQINK